MKLLARVALLLLAWSAVTIAESPIDGGWAGEIGTGGDKHIIQMVLKVDDTRLSGSIVGGGEEASIQDGTFTGTILQFKTVQGSGDHALTVKCIGSFFNDS